MEIKKIVTTIVGGIFLMALAPILGTMAAAYVVADSGDNPQLEMVFTLMAWVIPLALGALLIYKAVRELGEK